MRRLIEIWRLLNAPCEDMTHLISMSLDSELAFWPRFACQLHLLYCRACRRYRHQVTQLRAALRMLADRLSTGAPTTGPVLSNAARDRIARNLRKP